MNSKLETTCPSAASLSELLVLLKGVLRLPSTVVGLMATVFGLNVALSLLLSPVF